MTKSKKPTLAIVGAGRVGRALGRRLREAGWRIGAVVTRSSATAKAAVRAIGAGRPSVPPHHEILQAGVVLVGTTDDAVAPTAAYLATLGKWKGKVVLHTSGALSSAVLAPLRKRGAAVGSFHPMQTFSGRGMPRLHGVNCAMEGAPAAIRVARQIARAIGGTPVRVASSAKPAYHAAGGYAAMQILGLVETGTRILMDLGFTRRQAVGALARMARETLDNLEQHGPDATWTGPLARGDFQTIARHVKALKRYPREYLATYAAVTRLVARLMLPRDRVAQRRLRRILRGN